MAKNRRIPFGYQMKNGEIVTEPKEMYAVSKIFADYLKGKSLLEISRSIQEEKIPYHPGEDLTWNKNMVKRILENEKTLATMRIRRSYLPTYFIELIIRRPEKPLISA